MPSNLPSSFASAAAGQNTSRDARGGTRSDGRGNSSGDWSRQGRSTNGTLTFRRTSTTPSSQTSNQMQASTESIQSGVSDPAIVSAMPVGSTNVENATNPPRYSRDQILSIFATSEQSSSNQPDVSSLFLPGWNPGHANGTSARGWGKSTDTHAAPQEPDLCWNTAGSVKAVGLQEMSSEEKELFESDVNSTLKPPPQNKDGNHPGGGVMNGRKTSVSHGGPNNFGLNSPSSASRPGTRRRETTDTNPFSGGGGLVSPTTAARPSRDDPSYWFNRKNVDLKDSEPDDDSNQRDAGPPKSLPFGSLMRNNTTTGVTALGPSSPWQAPSPGGASGMGSFGNFAHPGSAIGERRPGPTRGESRLAHLIPKDGSDYKKEESSGADLSRPWRSRPRTDTDPFGDESHSGSAVLGGAQDTSPPPMTHQALRNQGFDTPVKGSAADFGMSGLNLGSHPDHDNEPLSPSETNPFRSPPGDRGEHDDGGEKSHGFGGIPEHVSGFSNLQRAFGHAAFDGSDRSQTSSVGAKTYPPLGNLTGWPSSGTPDRERGGGFPGFGGSLFGSVGDIQSPSLGSLSGVFGPATTTGLGGSGSISRGSKLGSLFPPAMQAQMHAHDNDSNMSDSIPDLRQSNPLGAIGRNPLVDHVREAESPLRGGRGIFADMFNPPEQSRTPGSSEPLHGVISSAAPGQAFTPTTNAPFSGGQPSEPPSAQARTMVMPDRMRWVYLDPQGNQQGPFTGLEMNDWYKAQFFTPNLRVKKLEDAEFEPLGQLIRRIGNSREPFLVPQIGIPHGPPSQTGPFSPSSGGVIQPPLVGAFPSFGRTLTAEEQNNLERRKQEEQFLLARQREYLASQQSLARMQVQGVPNLHHHSSAHSLHSQPSFGSITSPITMPPQPPIGAIGSGGTFFDSQTTPAAPGNTGPSRELFRDEDLAHLSEPERQLLAGLQNKGGLSVNVPQQQQQPVGMPPEEGSLRGQLPGTGDLIEDEQGFRGRLQEFEQLRAQRDAQMTEQQPTNAQRKTVERSPSPLSPTARPTEPQRGADEPAEPDSDHRRAAAQESAHKQYQQAQAAVAATKLSGLPMPFPPPQSATPLPAPAPQRLKSNLPEQYATSSRSDTPDVTPSSATVQPPPLAPWAKDAASESHKGPSLKEIQAAEAAEAAKAAKAEEAAALARRAMLEQETAREREKAAAIASGLPTTSTWGTASPANVGPPSSPWAKPAAVKGPAPGASAAAQASDKKKTLAEIQREEEAQKQKAKETAVQTGVASATGKRYADLASKPNATPIPSQPPGGSAAASPGVGWATVGAGGKVKIPTGPAQGRTTSTPNIKAAVTAANTVTAASAKPATKPAGSSAGNAKSEAMDEFNKWLHNQLSRGITGVTDISTFASTLMAFPAQADIIADAVYANSKTMDGRHFAQEFIRRKKLADKGVVEKSSAPASSPLGDNQSASTGGWNEVAKKSNHKESSPSDASIMQGAGFKVVPGRKKGKK
ncbi:hypothetical protein DL771_005609 [Monosporascus sp. 5C6A]|nr:hypothetical protein DL771_005609 [Monosporascus sp. 5C6A]